MDQFRRIKVGEKVRNVFVMSLRLSDHQILHNTASSSSFFDAARIFSLFSRVFPTSNLEFKEFNKTIIPLISRLLDMRLVIVNSALQLNVPFRKQAMPYNFHC